MTPKLERSDNIDARLETIGQEIAQVKSQIDTNTVTAIATLVKLASELVEIAQFNRENAKHDP